MLFGLFGLGSGLWFLLVVRAESAARQQALLVSQQRYLDLFHDTRDLIQGCDRAGKLRFANRA
jgi:hypothetical protein